MNHKKRIFINIFDIISPQKCIKNNAKIYILTVQNELDIKNLK